LLQHFPEADALFGYAPNGNVPAENLLAYIPEEHLVPEPAWEPELDHHGWNEQLPFIPPLELVGIAKRFLEPARSIPNSRACDQLWSWRNPGRTRFLRPLCLSDYLAQHTESRDYMQRQHHQFLPQKMFGVQAQVQESQLRSSFSTISILPARYRQATLQAEVKDLVYRHLSKSDSQNEYLEVDVDRSSMDNEKHTTPISLAVSYKKYTVSGTNSNMLYESNDAGTYRDCIEEAFSQWESTWLTIYFLAAASFFRFSLLGIIEEVFEGDHKQYTGMVLQSY
jgi:hypothetical protein